MKHEREWYTCDRCGEEIKENIDAWKMKPTYIAKTFREPEAINVISNEPYVDVYDRFNMLPDIKVLSMIIGYRKKEKLIHLCGKCREDFEKFMENKA